MGLYQEFRPQSFEEMVGNESSFISLKKKIESGKVHAFLFVGEKGTGKTTTARICARLLGADDVSRVEINAANKRGIDDARDIENEIRTLSFSGNPWVYIIDEVHMATKEWQSSMLKPLEDTPGHVYFFLCTTDPQKLLPTIKSRCSEYKFELLGDRELSIILRRTSKALGIPLSSEVRQLIIDKAEGSARTALVLLEQVQDVSEEEALLLLDQGELEQSHEVLELCRGLLKRASWSSMSEILRSLRKEDPEKIRRAVLGYMNSVLLNSRNENAFFTILVFSEPFFSSGIPGLTAACFKIISGN